MSLYEHAIKYSLELILIMSFAFCLIVPNFIVIGLVISFLFSQFNIFEFGLNQINLSEKNKNFFMYFLFIMYAILFFSFFKLALFFYVLVLLVPSFLGSFVLRGIGSKWSIDIDFEKILLLVFMMIALLINFNLLFFPSLCICFCYLITDESKKNELIYFFISLFLVLLFFSNCSFVTLSMVIIFYTALSCMEVLKFTYNFYSSVKNLNSLFCILANISNLGLILCIVSLCISSSSAPILFIFGCSCIVLDNLLLDFADVDLSLSYSYKREANGSLYSSLLALIVALNPWFYVLVEFGVACSVLSIFEACSRSGTRFNCKLSYNLKNTEDQPHSPRRFEDIMGSGLGLPLTL